MERPNSELKNAIELALALMALLAICIILLIVITNEPEQDTDPHFNQDYQIDLQEDGYLVKDEQGNVHFVPRNKLETWFLDDNL